MKSKGNFHPKQSLFSYMHPLKAIAISGSAATLNIPLDIVIAYFLPILNMGMPNWAIPFAYLMIMVFGVIQPLVGTMSDKCQSKLGRRRPFILAGYIFTSFAFILFMIYDSYNEEFSKSMNLLIMIGGIFILMLGTLFTVSTARTIVFDIVPKEFKVQVNFIILVETEVGALLNVGILAIKRYQFQLGFLLYSLMTIPTLIFGKENNRNNSGYSLFNSSSEDMRNNNNNNNNKEEGEDGTSLLSNDNDQSVRSRQNKEERGEIKEESKETKEKKSELFTVDLNLPGFKKMILALNFILHHKRTFLMELMLLLDNLSCTYFGTSAPVFCSQGLYDANNSSISKEERYQRLVKGMKIGSLMKMVAHGVTLLTSLSALFLSRYFSLRKILFSTHTFATLSLFSLFFMGKPDESKAWIVFMTSFALASNQAMFQTVPSAVCAQSSDPECLGAFMGGHGICLIAGQALANVIPLIVNTIAPTWTSNGLFYMQWDFLLNGIFCLGATIVTYFFGE